MLSPLRTRFGIPGVISVIALVFAMFGGAYAASNSSDGGKATASAKAKKGPRGPKGAKGDTGAQGPEGKQGPAGKDGSNGSPGSNGTNGKSVEVSGTAGGCAEGGATVQVKGEPGTAQEVCNGEEGEPGAAGEPWVVGTAPTGAVMQGTWVLPPATAVATGEEFFVPISTVVPIAKIVPEFSGITVLSSFFCKGTALDPQPATNPANGAVIPGGLCVYKAAETNIAGAATGSAGESLGESGGGVVFKFNSLAAGEVKGYGTWAMAAP
jgi:hypothetical protein